MSRPLRCILVGLLSIASLNNCFAVIPPVSQSVTVSGTQSDTIATFSGYSSPNAFITITDSNAVVGTTSSDNTGAFSKSLTNQTPGNHSFGIQSQDGAGTSTPQVNSVINLQPNAETFVGNILMPATISTQTGVRPILFGTATPGSTLTIFVNPDGITETATAGADGSWTHAIITQLASGTHTAYAVARTGTGLVSADSATVSFDVTCAIADYNCSGRVDMVDFSILMYYWGTSDPTTDLNNDGVVDLTDFSILMFYWNG